MKRLLFYVLILGLFGFVFCSCAEIIEEEENESESVDVTVTMYVPDTESAETEGVTETTEEDTEIPVYLNPDGQEFAALFGSFFHVESFTSAYGWDTGEEVVIFSVEYTANEPNPGTAMLSVNGGTPFDISCVQLSDICVTQEFIVVVPSFTDIGGPLYVFDYDGNLIFAAHDVTVEGAEFRELCAADNDGITVIASRIRHMELTGNAALELQAPYAAYQKLLWDDPTSDCMPGTDAELPDVFSVDLSCGWDAVPDALNPALVVSGEYRIPYLGEGQFGQIVPTEHMKTLQTFMEAQFGERTSAVTQETMNEPVTEPTDINPPTDTDLAAAVDHYLDLLTDGAGDLFSESEIIAKNPDAFDALVSLGTEALSYLQTAAADVPAMIADGESMKRLQRASLAMMAAYTIDPSLYDISVRLPDGKTEVTAKIGTFMALDFGGMRVNAYDRLVMTDLETGEGLAVHGFSEDLINVKLECTPDGRYVVYQWGIGSQHGFTTGGVFDTVWGWLQPFPTKEAFLAVLCPMTPGLTDLNPSDVEGISHTVTEWNADGNAIIYFNFRIGTAILTEGTYRFDPATGAVLDLHTHIHHLNTE